MPTIYVIAGCNGAGKTTLCKTLLPDYLKVKEFVNADEIARGLSPFNPEGAAFAAGRIMLERIHELASEKKDFAIETTLSSKTYEQMFRRLQSNGYEIVLLFVFVDSVQEAIRRVAARVKDGGHNIPLETIKRRYERGLRNLRKIYFDLADRWVIFDNTGENPIFVAEKKARQVKISRLEILNQIMSYD